MSQRERMWAGLGGIAFAVLTIAGFASASTPGGGYEESAIADYVARGHRAAVFSGLFLGLLGVLGLLVLLVGLRERLREGSMLSNVFAASASSPSPGSPSAEPRG